MLETFKNFSEALNWPLVVTLLALIYRKSILGVFEAIKQKITTAAKITIGKDGLTIEELIKQELAKSQDETMAMMAQGVGKTHELKPKNDKAFVEYDEGDPLKSKWNGQLEDKGKRISATVDEIPGSGLYRLKIFVRSIYQQEPLKGKVKFFLHPSFNNPNPVIEAKDGEACLQLVSYGSFTLGAQTEDGALLKLDLATDVVGVSENFKNS